MPRVLVLAQTPPPEHGQSRMVAEALQALRADARFDVRHVNLAVSAHAAEIGGMGPRKALRLAAVALRALSAALRYRPDILYYVPAPPKRSAVLRDALLLPWLRRLVPCTVYHWHASGLGAWVQSGVGVRQRWVRRLHAAADLSLVLDPCLEADAQVFAPGRLTVLPNGFPDPFPDGAAARASLQSRAVRRLDAAGERQLLFMARCEESKGLFAALEGAACWSQSRLRAACLQVAGEFPDAATRARWDAAVARTAQAAPNLRVRTLGFVSGAEKHALFAASDALLLPTLYPYEAQPLVAVESLAHGLPVAATRWRGLPFILPPETRSWIEAGRSASAVAEALGLALEVEPLEPLRARYEAQFSLQHWSAGLRQALADLTDI